MIYMEVNFNERYVGQAFFHDVSGFLYRYGYALYGLYQIAYSQSGPIGLPMHCSCLRPFSRT